MLLARLVQMQLAKPLTLRECVLFPAPEDIADAIAKEQKSHNPQSEEEALALFM